MSLASGSFNFHIGRTDEGYVLLVFFLVPEIFSSGEIRGQSDFVLL